MKVFNDDGTLTFNTALPDGISPNDAKLFILGYDENNELTEVVAKDVNNDEITISSDDLKRVKIFLLYNNLPSLIFTEEIKI